MSSNHVRSTAESQLKVNSVKDLHMFGEAFTTTDGESRLKYTYFCFLDNNNVAYFGHATVTKFELTGKIIRESLKAIPDNDIYPEPPRSLAIFRGPIHQDVHIKYPDIKDWDDYKGTDFISRLFLGEIEAFEILRIHPHPNIITYHGCIINRERVTGIVLDRCKKTLEEFFEKKNEELDKVATFKDITSAVQHLHSLGLAHNDLNPANIMLDGLGKAVLIDLGSCKPFGARLQEAGTVGWIEKHYFFSEKEHDESALKKLHAWIMSR